LKVLFDTNVVLDILMNRAPHDVAAIPLLVLVEEKKLEGASRCDHGHNHSLPGQQVPGIHGGPETSPEAAVTFRCRSDHMGHPFCPESEFYGFRGRSSA